MFRTDQGGDVRLDSILVHHDGVKRIPVIELEPLHLLVEGLRSPEVQINAKTRFPEQAEKSLVREPVEQMSTVHVDQDLPGIGGERTKGMKITVLRG